jgi:hypothetical protein
MITGYTLPHPPGFSRNLPTYPCSIARSVDGYCQIDRNNPAIVFLGMDLRSFMDVRNAGGCKTHYGLLEPYDKPWFE